METTVAYAPKISSGIDVVDETWGGLYRGASYLVYGRAASGRGLLPLTVAHAGAEDGDRGLYVTSDTFEELASRARRIRFNLSTWVETGLLEVVQIPSLGDLDETTDELLVQALDTLITEVEDKRPHRVLIDTFMPFIGFRSFGRFRTSFISMLERIDACDATLMLVMAEPANQESERVIEFMRSQTTAAIRVELAESSGSTSTRKLSLMPSIGHAGQAAVKLWHLSEQVPPAPSQQQDQSRRFRFSEEFEDEDSSPSLADARWDAPENSDEPSAGQPDTDVNGASHGHPTGQSYLITPFKLGSQEGGLPSTGEKGRRLGPEDSGPSRSSEPEERIRPVPLGRHRKRVENDSSDHPLTATITPGRGFDRAGRGDERPSAPVPPREAGGEPADAPEEAVSHTDRESFRARLQQRFLRSSVNDVPFLLIAMRMDRREQASSRPFDFEFILDLVNELLREQDDVYVDLERERLIVMLADTESEGSRRFFAELRRRLREEAPHQADYLLQSVSAIVVPNGRPFQNAEEFLSYALSEG